MSDKQIETRISNLEKQVITLATRQSDRDDENESSIQNTNINVSSVEKNITSDTFNTRVYEEGEYTLSDNILWRCKVRTSSAPTEGAEWESKNVVDAILELSERIALLENK